MENLTFFGGLPSWVLILIALGTCALLVYQFVGLRERLSLRQSALLVSLRGSVYALLILFLTNPVFIEERVTQLRRPLVLLLDTSESMGLPASQQGNGGKSRIEILKEKLLGGNDPLIERLARNVELGALVDRDGVVGGHIGSPRSGIDSPGFAKPTSLPSRTPAAMRP